MEFAHRAKLSYLLTVTKAGYRTLCSRICAVLRVCKVVFLRNLSNNSQPLRPVRTLKVKSINSAGPNFLTNDRTLNLQAHTLLSWN